MLVQPKKHDIGLRESTRRKRFGENELAFGYLFIFYVFNSFEIISVSTGVIELGGD